MASRTAAAQSPAGSVGRRFMAPPAPRAPAEASRWKPLVLEEEEWAEALESIIERDFFPDIPKLQSKLEWLQARSLPAKALLCAGRVLVRVGRQGLLRLVILCTAHPSEDTACADRLCQLRRAWRTYAPCS